jgi:hypothetical protein
MNSDEKSVTKRPLRRVKRGWENIIKVDLRETGCEARA